MAGPAAIPPSTLVDQAERDPATLARTVDELGSGADGPARLLAARAALRSSPAAGSAGGRTADRLLRDALAAAFSGTEVDLVRVDAATPAWLAQVVEHERVHAVRDDADLARRVAPDRRIYGLTHRSIGDQLLVFVELALCDDLAGSIDALLNQPDVATTPPATAIFYSINNCSPALAGIRIGRTLLVAAMGALAAEIPTLGSFATLSPMPGFRHALRAGDPELAEAASADPEAVRADLEVEAARYLVTTEGGRVPDPVGHFHLGNGACVERVQWMGDPSLVGMRRSFGLMVNYTYDPTALDGHTDAYREGAVCVSEEVEALARSPR